MTKARLQQAARMGEIRERLDAGEPLSLDDQNWLFAAIDTVYKENYRLRAALEKYGEHNDAGCLRGVHCVCGLAEALTPPAAPAVAAAPPREPAG